MGLPEFEKIEKALPCVIFYIKEILINYETCCRMSTWEELWSLALLPAESSLPNSIPGGPIFVSRPNVKR